MFKLLYELITGQNVDPIYGTDVYPSVGLFSLILSVLFVVIFYLLLGRWKPVWHKTAHWLITLVLLILVLAFFALTQAKAATQLEAFDAFMYKFAFANVIYGFFYYCLLSFLFKRFSIFAKRTPF